MDLSKKITITKEDFLKATADALEKGRTAMIVKDMPMMMLPLTGYTFDIIKILFGEETEEITQTELTEITKGEENNG